MRRHFHKIARRTLAAYAASVIVLSCIGAGLSLNGKVRPVASAPSGAYETVTFKSQARDGLDLEGWYLPAAGTTALVLVHGWGGNRATMLELAETAQAAGTPVLTFDLRGGTGKNTYGDRESGDVAGAMAWLASTKGTPSERVVLAGNSMGGAAVAAYAASDPVAGVILISSVYDLNKTRYRFAEDYHLVFPSIYAAGIRLVERYAYGVRQVEPLALLPRIQAPILILHTFADKKASFTDVAALQESHPSTSRYRFVVTDGNHTHYTHTSEGRNLLNQETLAFVASVSNP